MLDKLREEKVVKKVLKSPWYIRARQYFPMADPYYLDDRHLIDDAEVVRLAWPDHITKPRVGIIKDFGKDPRWTKYCRFLDNNSFDYDFYYIHKYDWIDAADEFDLIIGIESSELQYLHEVRTKFYFLETFMGKFCYPSMHHIFLYEDKCLEAYISQVTGIPFAKTFITFDKDDAIVLAETLNYPFVSKINPTSGSVGVELVRNPSQAKRIIEDAFSKGGRKTHLLYYHQKNHVYFQEFIPNDGYDIRTIMIENFFFGYYRKVLDGDFRASGMNLVEKRELPEEVLDIARQVYDIIQSPMLVVDMVHGLDDRYHIIEYSPVCLIDDTEQLHVDDKPGVYVQTEDGSYHFQERHLWVHELALKKFLLMDYLPKINTEKTRSYRQTNLG
jgi:glutathione synthase/RimK-type ligase-like ATP-grasp enzyme